MGRIGLEMIAAPAIMEQPSGRSSMAERQLPKLHTWVRFPSPAPFWGCDNFINAGTT